MFSHNCIKCKAKYNSKDEDPYLCESCNGERLALAKEIDSKVGSTIGQQPNGWNRIEDLKKKSGVSKNGMTFINAKFL